MGRSYLREDAKLLNRLNLVGMSLELAGKDAKHGGPFATK
jgi:hypothetical protein